ncbi:hypothetical protein AZ002_001944, partial [Citrobacter freundii]
LLNALESTFRSSSFIRQSV